MTKGEAQVAAAEKAIQAKGLEAAAKKMRQAAALAAEAHALLMQQPEFESEIGYEVINAKDHTHYAALKLNRKAIARRSEIKRILEEHRGRRLQMGNR
mgnify:CR=1 FL=1